MSALASSFPRGREPAVLTQGLAKRFGAVEAVRGIDLEVAPGEAFGFLGPNGAGKSTTINMLCTLTKPSGGTARVAGCAVVTGATSATPHRPGVPGPHARRLPVRRAEPCAFTPSSTGSRALSARRIQHLMHMVGLWERRASLVRTFSGGMKRRLEIARGLLHSPRVLFLDEPTIGLDPQTRSSIWAYVRALKQHEEITIFMTTHYMEEAEYCDRIAIMDAGRIVALGSPETLKAEVGRDRVQICTADNTAAIAALKGRFGLEAAMGDGAVTFASRRGRAVRPPALRRAGVAIQWRCAPDARRSSWPTPALLTSRRRGLALGAKPHGAARATDSHDRPLDVLGSPATAPVRVPVRSFRNDLRVVKIVWQRELIRFFRDKPRILTALLQPMLYLFILGTGMSSMVAGDHGDLKVFLFPGVMTMAVLFTSFLCAGSLVWDREFGFMREMLVAPVRRGAILLGKCLGGATAGTFQGLMVLAVGGLAGIRYSPSLVLTLVGELLIVAFAITALGLLVAVHPGDPVVHGLGADAGHAPVLSLGCAFPALGSAGLAHGPHPRQPAHLRRRPAAAGGAGARGERPRSRRQLARLDRADHARARAGRDLRRRCAGDRGAAVRARLSARRVATAGRSSDNQTRGRSVRNVVAADGLRISQQFRTCKSRQPMLAPPGWQIDCRY
jgi:ABC-2 type transport system ATP-binding protein